MTSLDLLHSAKRNDVCIVRAIIAYKRLPFEKDVIELIAEELAVARYADVEMRFLGADLNLQDVSEALGEASTWREKVEILRTWGTPPQAVGGV